MKTTLLFSAIVAATFSMTASASAVTARINEEIREPLSSTISQQNINVSQQDITKKQARNLLGQSDALKQHAIYISEVTASETSYSNDSSNEPTASKPLDW
ncbi:hypothetical protein [Halomonas sp. M20]|uniref:hypothetical protein n=1 Tax=Halomonas sp. M20 TaxID=2763264 RepID=UPI001D0A08CE|nr:hypothetical protein [Halomonas sp. M20]